MSRCQKLNLILISCFLSCPFSNGLYAQSASATINGTIRGLGRGYYPSGSNHHYESGHWQQV